MQLPNPFRLPPQQMYTYLACISAGLLLVTGAIFDFMLAWDNWISGSRYLSCGLVLGIVFLCNRFTWSNDRMGVLYLFGYLAISGHLAIALYQTQLALENSIAAYLFISVNALSLDKPRLVVSYLGATCGIMVITASFIAEPQVTFLSFALDSVIYVGFLALLISLGISARAETSRLAAVNAAIFDQSSDAMMYGNMESATIIKANERTMQMFATTDRDKIFKSIQDAVFTRFKGQRKREVISWLQARELRETLKFTRGDDRFFWGDASLQYLDGFSGNILMVRITDVTPQVRSQSDLDQTRILLNRSQAMARVGGWEYRADDGTWSLTESARHILQIPPGLDSMWSGLFGNEPKHRRRASTTFTRCLTTGEHFDIELPITTYKGRVFQARAMGEPITEDGVITRVVGVFMDISETRQREQELEAARDTARDAAQARTQFLANMSHEIRTPMNGIIGMTSLLQSTELNEEQSQQVDTIRSSGDLLLSIINEILDFSKIDAGQMILESAPFSLSDLVRHTLAPLQLLADEKGIKLSSSWAVDIDQTTHYQGDAGRIRQVLTNLLGNALKFTSKGSVTLEISCDSPHSQRGLQHLTLAVKDTGIGIDPDRAEALFEPFRQAEASTTRRFGGTGLGLSISKRLTELMQGTLLVVSEPGVGSTFTVKLPLRVLAIDPLVSQTPSKDAVRISLSSLRVLVAEDNLVNQKVSLQILKRLRADADLAENGAQAVAMVQQRPYDVVLMDMQMPELDGIDATRQIRKLANIEQPYIVAMTANALSEDKENCLAAGMDEFLSKPVRLEDVRKLLTPVAQSLEGVS